MTRKTRMSAPMMAMATGLRAVERRVPVMLGNLGGVCWGGQSRQEMGGIVDARIRPQAQADLSRAAWRLSHGKPLADTTGDTGP
jgi:hypothetical protein